MSGIFQGGGEKTRRIEVRALSRVQCQSFLRRDDQVDPLIARAQRALSEMRDARARGISLAPHFPLFQQPATAPSRPVGTAPRPPAPGP